MAARYYDRKGNPLSDWPADLEHEARVVAQTTLGPDTAHPGLFISTVWLVLEHGDDDEGRPLIFETMTFRNTEHTREDILEARYATEEEALRGHARTVRRYSDKVVDAAARLGDEDF